MYFQLCLIFFSLIFSNVFADFETQLSKIRIKSNIHKMRNIDCIYLISLKARPEKKIRSLDQLSQYQIEPYVFTAVNGWELTVEGLNEVGVKFEEGMKEGIWGTHYVMQNGQIEPEHEIMYPSGKSYVVHCMGRGAIGCSLSHLSILKHALDNGYNRIWIMEDDIDVIGDPTTIPSLIDRLNQLVGENKWDILFTDIDFRNASGLHVPCTSYAPLPNFTPKNPSKFAKRKKISEEFSLIGARYGTHSLILNRSGMQKLYNFHKNCKGVFLPIDMTIPLPPKIKLYCLNYDLISQLTNAISDNGSPPPSP